MCLGNPQRINKNNVFLKRVALCLLSPWDPMQNYLNKKDCVYRLEMPKVINVSFLVQI